MLQPEQDKLINTLIVWLIIDGKEEPIVTSQEGLINYEGSYDLSTKKALEK